jgi:transposase
VNAIFGASAAGKTTIAFQMLEAQAAKRTFLGRETAGWPYLVIWQDRGKADLEEQLHNLGLVGVPPEFHVITEAERNLGPAKAIEQIFLERGQPARAVFVEGVDLWLDDVCNSKEVSNQIHKVRSVAEHYDLSLIVSLGAPKAKAKEGYVAARDRIIGSTTWGRVLSTLMEVKEQENTHRRLVSILPRADKAQAVQMEMVEGRLVEHQGIEVQISEVSRGSKKDAIFTYLNRYPDATPETLAKAFAPMGESTAYRWISRWEGEVKETVQ